MSSGDGCIPVETRMGQNCNLDTEGGAEQERGRLLLVIYLATRLNLASNLVVKGKLEGNFTNTAEQLHTLFVAPIACN